MSVCTRCGGKLRRVHRSTLQRVGYAARYQCTSCRAEEAVPRFAFRMGNECRCPRCGTTHLDKLKEPDVIDRMDSGIWNLAARLGGGKLYHCCFCRLQFYDRRPMAESHEPEIEDATHRTMAS